MITISCTRTLHDYSYLIELFSVFGFGFRSAAPSHGPPQSKAAINTQLYL